MGVTGPAGKDAVTLRTAIDETGDPANSGLNAIGQHLATGDYLVTFRSRSAAGCIYSATLAWVGGIQPAANRVSVAQSGDGVRVRTYYGTTPEDSGFHLIVVCS